MRRMLRQCCAWLVAVMVGITPIASELCLAACARGSTTSPGHEHHDLATADRQTVAGHEGSAGTNADPATHHHEADAGAKGKGRFAVNGHGERSLQANCCVTGLRGPARVSVVKARAQIDPPAAEPLILDVGAPNAAALHAWQGAITPSPVPLALRRPLRV
jgi:hypothetical protein